LALEHPTLQTRTAASSVTGSPRHRLLPACPQAGRTASRFRHTTGR